MIELSLIQDILYITYILGIDLVVGISLLSNTGRWFGYMYQSLANVLFLCLTWLASMMLEHLSDQLPGDGTPSHPALNPKLLKWERAFELIRDYIDKINGSFGFILLITLGKSVFYSVMIIYNLLTRLSWPINIDFLLKSTVGIINHNFNFILIILVCQRIEQKVITSNRSISVDWRWIKLYLIMFQIQKMTQFLRKLHFNQIEMQMKVGFFRSINWMKLFWYPTQT